MRNPLFIVALISVSLMAACKQAEQASAADPAVPAETGAVAAETMPTTIDAAAWAGKWIGPEGMFATITPGADGNVSLEMQSDLDTRGIYKGMATADGIIFRRGEETLVLTKATGNQTGLKYLAGKKDCIMVKSGEGYCRD